MGHFGIIDNLAVLKSHATGQEQGGYKYDVTFESYRENNIMLN